MPAKNTSRERQEAPIELTPVTLRQYPPFVPSEDTQGDRRFFVTTQLSENAARNAALGYYQIDDEELLQFEVIKKGLKKFLFFGPQKCTYRYSLKPIYKKILTPFLINLVRLMRLRVFVTVSYREPIIDISFKGSDERLLQRNGNELLISLETLAKLYLAKKVQLKPEVRLQVRLTQENQGPRTQGRSERLDENGLIAMVEKIKKQVLEKQEAVLLKPLDSKERRIVHQHLSQDEMVKTTSMGDGRLKRIEISLR